MSLSASLGAALRAFVTRDFLVARSYRLAVLLDLVYLVIDLAVYFFISRTFVHVRHVDLGGAPTYFGFAAVGVILTLVLTSTSTGLAVRIRTEQLTGTLEAVVAQPVNAGQLALGISGTPFLAAMARAALYLVLAVSLLGLDVSAASWPGVVAMLAVSGIALSSVGIVCAAATLIVKRGEIVTGLFAFGLGLLGGGFFPVSTLPSWLRPLADVVPTRFAFDGLRAALYKGNGWTGDVIVLAAMSMAFLPASVLLFSAAMRAAKRSGSLAEY